MQLVVLYLRRSRSDSKRIISLLCLAFLLLTVSCNRDATPQEALGNAQDTPSVATNISLVPDAPDAAGNRFIFTDFSSGFFIKITLAPTK